MSLNGGLAESLLNACRGEGESVVFSPEEIRKAEKAIGKLVKKVTEERWLVVDEPGLMLGGFI